MAINGIETVVFGAQEPEALCRFFDDFGLKTVRKDAGGRDYLLAEGSKVQVRRDDDPSLPPRFLPGDGPREVIWGVDSEAALDAIEAELKRDRAVTRDASGTLRTVDPNGICIGFRVFARQPLEPLATEENTLTHRVRWNSPRKWYDRAAPKLVQHVVFGVPQVDAAVDFYVHRLNFRVTDVSRGRGIFMRCDGRNEHHNLFLLQQPLGFHHMAFGVESIDELMAGANHMQRHGWKAGFGFGRHRISSMIYFYLKCPTGGDIEYTADGDYIDDNWRPSLWNPPFGNQHWSGEVKEGAIRPAPEVMPLPQPLPPFSQIA